MAKILVVDDEAVDRELVRRCLEPIENLESTYANDGEQALALVSQDLPDIVLTDLRMPGISGLELVERLHTEFPLLPLILMTSKGGERIAVQALKAGASSYVPKDELKDELQETINEVLEVADATKKQSQVLGSLRSRVAHFELTNDATLFTHLVANLVDSLQVIGFGTESDRTQIGIALMEALSNALIHGNLELDSDLRKSDRERFDDLLFSRSKEEPYRSRLIHCTVTETPEKVTYVIRDEGKGFDPNCLPDPTEPENLLEVCGRGVMLIRTFMDSVEYSQKGNEITMVKIGSEEAESVQT
jgi:CheY-like chemotaxis protein/anti-sigma regulatory factor (Ser/Thr protein kinase)